MSDEDTKEEQAPEKPPEPSDEVLEAMRRQRFQDRVQRVLEVMKKERIDWRGVPFLAPDGTIGARVVPIEMRSRSNDES